MLLYNCGTWALPVSIADKLDRAQRKMIRHVLGLKSSNKITNADLYVHSVVYVLLASKLCMHVGVCLVIRFVSMKTHRLYKRCYIIFNAVMMMVGKGILFT